MRSPSHHTAPHRRLAKLGITPVTKDSLPQGRKFPHVLFSAPPSGSADYGADVGAWQ